MIRWMRGEIEGQKILHWMIKRSEKRKHCALAVVRQIQKISPRR